MKVVILVNDGAAYPSGGVAHLDTCPQAKKKKGKVLLTDPSSLGDSLGDLKDLGFPAKPHSCMVGK